MAARNILLQLNKQRIFIGIVLIVFFLSLASSSFLTYANVMNILFQVSMDGIVATGMTVLMLLGDIDLSAGATMAVVGTIIILLQPFGIAVSVAAGVLAGILIGVINGLLVTRLKINSLPATLGMMISLNGLVLLLTNSQTIRGGREEFLVLGNGDFLSIPYPVIIYAVLLVLFIGIMRRSVWGRNIYAAGGNPIASRFFGINVTRLKFSAFVTASFLFSISGVIITSRLNIASGIIGRDTPLLVITAALLGGTNLLGGEGGVYNTFQGILLLGIIANGMIMIQVPPTWQIVVKGLLLIIIVSIDGAYMKNAKYR